MIWTFSASVRRDHRDNFLYFYMKTYVVTNDWNRLAEMVLAERILIKVTCFHSKIRMIISDLT